MFEVNPSVLGVQLEKFVDVRMFGQFLPGNRFPLSCENFELVDLASSTRSWIFPTTRSPSRAPRTPAIVERPGEPPSHSQMSGNDQREQEQSIVGMNTGVSSLRPG